MDEKKIDAPDDLDNDSLLHDIWKEEMKHHWDETDLGLFGEIHREQQKQREDKIIFGFTWASFAVFIGCLIWHHLTK